MFQPEQLINIMGIAGIATILTLVMVIAAKMDRIKSLLSAVDNLERSLDEMDEQAKLIVRTDMELNKTQEELDKKITGLYALQRLSRNISTTLEENQIFRSIDPSHMADLGFEKCCGFLWSERDRSFQLKINIGYPPNEIEAIKSDSGMEELYMEAIKEQKAISSRSLQYDSVLKDRICGVLKVNSFVISPILPQEGSRGILFVGTEDTATFINEGDEELINILTYQLGQALENARLFEKTWRAQHELEKKVDERTAELTRALNEIKIVSKRKTDFISSVSHELRTPLTSVKGYASILLTGKLGNIPPEVKERLEKINRHSDELVHMVNDLLDIARIESGKISMKKEPLDLKSALDGVEDLLGGQLKDKGIEFSYKVPAEAGLISADHSQINRVFINIVGNAMKFTPKGGKISVAARKTDGAVQVDIADTGCGIPQEAQDKIFEEFYRVDNDINQQVKGTGLGLSLVKHIIEAHGGKIWFASKSGSGTTFSFVLPQNG